MDELGALGARRHRQVDRQRAQRRELGRVAGQRVPRRGAATSARSPHACTVDVLEGAQLARQVLDVHARAAVDVRRVLAGEQRDPHAVDPHRPWG